MTSTSVPTRKHIRPHRKSRNGCSACKLRKVKCDESKPCGNCHNFGLPCDLITETGRVDVLVCPPVTRRGRGRPRKIWTATSTPLTSVSPLAGVTPPPESQVSATNCDSPTIDLADAQLLLHFITKAAETLAADKTNMQEFWKSKAPHMGLRHPFVLHLLFAVAALHLAYDTAKSDADKDLHHGNLYPPRKDNNSWRSLARRHLTAGLSGFSTELSRASSENCGPLYLGAVLTSYCTFGTGPASANDLLVCTADGEDTHDHFGTDILPVSSSWMPFIHGVRLLRESFTMDQIFAGPMESFRAGPPPAPMKDPVHVQEGFPRLHWEEALGGLRSFISATLSEDTSEVTTPTSQAPKSDPDPTETKVCLEALDDLISVYVAVYGRQGAAGETTCSVSSEKQFVFGWLYRIGRVFVSCVRRRDPSALLVLAHYAVLLNRDAIYKGWYIRGWKGHIITRVADMVVNDEHRQWMRWPLEQAVLEGGEGQRFETESRI